MGSCDRGSAVVGFLFMVLVCCGGLCNDGSEAVVVVSTSRFVGCGGFFWVRFEFGLVGCVMNCGVCGLWTFGVLCFGGWVSCHLSISSHDGCLRGKRGLR